MAVEFKINLQKFVLDIARETLPYVAADIRTQARRLVRKRDRRLMNSIRIDITGPDERVVLAETSYALAQEFGRPDLPSYGFTPYMRPAGDYALSDERMKRSVDLAAEKAVRKNKL